MILDNLLEFSNSVALTASANSEVVDFSIDRNVGIGEELAVAIFLESVANGSDNDETYTAAIETASNEAFSAGKVTLHTVTINRNAASGSQYLFTLPRDTSVDRFLRIAYTLGGTSPSVTLSAYLTLNKAIPANVTYKSGYKISG